MRPGQPQERPHLELTFGDRSSSFELGCKLSGRLPPSERLQGHLGLEFLAECSSLSATHVDPYSDI